MELEQMYPNGYIKFCNVTKLVQKIFQMLTFGYRQISP